MARMVPPTISPDVKSSAERKIYEWLEDLSWENCIVLHSLGMAEHVKNIFGEIDFVILADEGVLCIEVKGGIVKRANGIWQFINRYGKISTKHEGPYQQVQGNTQSLRQYLAKRLNKDDPILKCQYACCVMTPDCQIDDEGRNDVIPDITFDITMHQKDLPVFFEGSFQYWKNKMMEKHHHFGAHLSNSDKARLLELLRGDFAFVPSMALILERTDEALLSLTEEQYIVTQSFASNKRILVSGPAGTGKTLLAMEQCRRIYAENKRVLYLCYNRLIAIFVSKKFQQENKSIDVYTFPSFLINALKLQDIPENNEDFYAATLPEMFLNKAGTLFEENQKYDHIVIDEGQDLMNSAYIMCLDEILKGGLQKGRWAIYYDANQNIFGEYKELEAIREDLEDRAACFNLTVNCRNTRRIGEGNWINTNIKQAPIMKADGEEIIYHQFTEKAEERKLLFQAIRKLRAEGISRSDIVILSPMRIDNEDSCLYNAKIPGDIGEIRFNDFNSLFRDDVLSVYTIQAFKGLEAKVVLLIDICHFSDESSRLLNYVAMSRARTLLEIFSAKEAEPERQQMILTAILSK